MIINIEEAERLVEKYQYIIDTENKELVDMRADGKHYSDYGDYLMAKTKFNRKDCTLCVGTFGKYTYKHCKNCIWSLAKDSSEWKRVEVEEENEYFCNNQNYKDIEISIDLKNFKRALKVRVEKLKQLITEVKNGI